MYGENDEVTKGVEVKPELYGYKKL